MTTSSVSTPLVAAILAVVALCGCGLTAASDEELMGGPPGSDAGADSSIDGSSDDGDAQHDGPLDREAAADISSPDVACFPPDKICAGLCVSATDPEYGCTADGCTPCAALDHAKLGCSNGECLVFGCDADWGNCDSDPTNGCETPLLDLSNCGECESHCSLPHAIAACSTGACAIEACDPGWGDCNNNDSDGCETDLRTLVNCGACGLTCTVAPPATPTCVSGTCMVDGCDTEVTGLADCDGNPASGCETDVRTTTNCGSCGNVCSGIHVGAWSCTGSGGSSTFSCGITGCEANWDDCDNLPGNGCETDVRASVEHCGVCGGDCSNSNVVTRVCINGLCSPTCAAGRADCNGPAPGNSDDGCETDVGTLANCGACGQPCALAHASESCSTGACVLAACDSGWADCDMNSVNGCETSLNSLTNCGGCGVTCNLTHATESCPAGSCLLGTCDTGWTDCSAAPGCETSLNTDVSHCGACGRACSGVHVSGSLKCTGGVCDTTSCEAGWSNLAKPPAPTPDDGCETPTG